MRKFDPTSALPTGLIPLLVFIGLVGLGFLLKRILPIGTTIHLSKNMVIGLVGGGAILVVLLTIIVVLVLKS